MSSTAERLLLKILNNDGTGDIGIHAPPLPVLNANDVVHWTLGSVPVLGSGDGRFAKDLDSNMTHRNRNTLLVSLFFTTTLLMLLRVSRKPHPH